MEQAGGAATSMKYLQTQWRSSQAGKKCLKPPPLPPLPTPPPTVFVGLTSRSKECRDTSNEKPVNNTPDLHIDGRQNSHQWTDMWNSSHPRNARCHYLEVETKRIGYNRGQLQWLAQDYVWKTLVVGLGISRGQRQWWWWMDMICKWLRPGHSNVRCGAVRRL